MFVKKVNNFTNGDAIFETNTTTLIQTKLKVSAFCNATRFGTSSPYTKVKNDKTTVTSTNDICEVYGIFKNFKAFANCCDIPVAADALAKKPDNVIAT